MYAGHCEEYVFLLKLVRPVLTQQFPDLDIHLACRDDFMYLLDGDRKTLSRSVLKKRHAEFGYIREIRGKMKGPHPIYELFTESDLPIPTLCNHVTTDCRLCYINPEGSLPTKRMTAQQIEACTEMAQFQGYHVRVTTDHNTTKQAGWVIGVENISLFEAAVQGKRTSLVPTGVGTKLYEGLFPKGEILRI